MSDKCEFGGEVRQHPTLRGRYGEYELRVCRLFGSPQRRWLRECMRCPVPALLDLLRVIQTIPTPQDTDPVIERALAAAAMLARVKTR